ncbi:glycerophosphodiester phosphodiesterase family protein [Sphingomonas sanxanigenens]|uniref:glycerophosphodiester phosphodiesterase family protein n=1 Tax=Sphingomonas sanxanigenens TaxID=397260 RepID=UPI0004BC4476|nr:glycerophosphodiester phosphodiesterase family protein [Sphingomonas sanxanigenens]
MRLSLSARLDRWLAPAPGGARAGFLKTTSYAHRGLHGDGLIENSRAAALAAIAAGHGIECDVQAAADGEAFVFHDAVLDRLTGERGALADRTPAALAAIRLTGTDETLPRLTELLDLIGGRATLLIEVKARNAQVGRLCRSVLDALLGYEGVAAVMSFNPEVGHWFAVNAPGVVRGLVMTEEKDHGWRGRLRRHAALWRAKPDFLAYDVRDLPSRFAAAQRARGLPLLTWTVRSDAARQIAVAHADAIIYERPVAG